MSVCSVCGRKGHWQEHHPTGRDENDIYLDVVLTLPLCHDHHTLCHDDWQTLELAEVSSGLTLVERVELCLRRLAACLARIDCGQGGGTFWGKLAQALGSWASELRRFRAALDECYPDWRSHPGFYPSG